MNNQALENRLIAFSVAIISFSKHLETGPAGIYMRSQIIRSGTAPALNYAEARDAESLKDFIHKLKIALKELRETQVALKITKDARLSKSAGLLDTILKENSELVAILISSIKTSKKRLHQG
jgi:four helix bundle protein